MNTVDLVDAAVKDQASFKWVGQKLDPMPPDKVAAKRLTAAYKRTEIPPWLAAYLLGCVGDVDGYETAQHILLENPGQSAESYAGVALAKIRGESAYADLTTIIFNDARPKVRRGAGYGLAHHRNPRVIPILIDAFNKERLPHNDVYCHIANCGPGDSALISLLNSSSIRQQKLGCAVADMLLWTDGGYTPPGEQVASHVYSVLSRDSLPFNTRRFSRLVEWATANP